MGAADHHLHALGLAQGDAEDDADERQPPPVSVGTTTRPTAAAEPGEEHGEDAADGAARAAPPIAGLIRKAALDDRPRRSMSYRHTDPYDVAVDESTGLEYEIRACKYCDTAFSFKGGTTSAALRHLRLAHPNEFYGAGGAPPPPPRALPDLLASPPGSQRQQQHQAQQPPPTEPSDEPRQEDHQHAHQHDERPEEEHHAPHPGQHQDPRTENCAAEVGHGEPLNVNEPAQETRPIPPRVHYHKRRRHEDDSHGGLHLTVNQLAISHFIAHYKLALPPAKRLAFVKHLAYNDREAAMYNVLDDDLLLEFLTQFTMSPQTSARDA